MKNKLTIKFKEDYMEYTNACIAYSETRETYEPLSWDRDCEWVQNWIKDNCRDILE